MQLLCNSVIVVQFWLNRTVLMNTMPMYEVFDQFRHCQNTKTWNAPVEARLSLTWLIVQENPFRNLFHIQSGLCASLSSHHSWPAKRKSLDWMLAAVCINLSSTGCISYVELASLKTDPICRMEKSNTKTNTLLPTYTTQYITFVN